MWSLAAAAVLVAGLSLSLALGGTQVGHRSALVLSVLLSVGVWLAALLLRTPRTAFVTALVAVALLDVAALPVRNASEYDERQAFFRTDQVLSARVPAPADVFGGQQLLVLLVEPVFPTGAAEPTFGLAGEVGSAGPLTWACAFERRLQHLALPVPPLAGSEPIDVRLHLTGSPSRETDYLVVYASAPRGGFLASLVAPANVSPGTTMCSPRA